MNLVGLFAGIGGIELGLKMAGHESSLLCEIDPAACAVLKDRFEGVPIEPDVKRLRGLPSETELLCAGFPCQDISQAGMTAGIDGRNSGLVHEVFRLLRRQRVPWVLLENVPFMLQLGRGRAMSVIADELQVLGYRWAYRVVDTRSFGLPQRRKRVFLVASNQGDPRDVLFSDEAGEPPEHDFQGRACGFYWTEGLRGLGWAVDAVPTLKGGSTVGIPSPPAIWMPDDSIITPEIRDAERLQGFDAGWTAPAAKIVRESFRWKLVGNSVSVAVAHWLGHRLLNNGGIVSHVSGELLSGEPWPSAASFDGDKRCWHDFSHWPVRQQAPPLAKFLKFPTKALSHRATRGFLSRLEISGLDYPKEFHAALKRHVVNLAARESPELNIAWQ